MQREIKFRAKNKSTNKWLYFTLEDLAHGRVFNEDRSENWSIREIGYENIGYQYQYSGYKVKKGLEICEGDIYTFDIPSKRKRQLFVLEDLRSFFTNKGLDEGEYGWDYHTIYIVGNIMDNPELIP